MYLCIYENISNTTEKKYTYIYTYMYIHAYIYTHIHIHISSEPNRAPIKTHTIEGVNDRNQTNPIRIEPNSTKVKQGTTKQSKARQRHKNQTKTKPKKAKHSTPHKQMCSRVERINSTYAKSNAKAHFQTNRSNKSNTRKAM